MESLSNWNEEFQGDAAKKIAFIYSWYRDELVRVQYKFKFVFTFPRSE